MFCCVNFTVSFVMEMNSGTSLGSVSACESKHYTSSTGDSAALLHDSSCHIFWKTALYLQSLMFLNKEIGAPAQPSALINWHHSGGSLCFARDRVCDLYKPDKMVKLHYSYKKLLQIYKFSSNIIGTPLLPSRFVPSHQNRHEIRFKVRKCLK